MPQADQHHAYAEAYRRAQSDLHRLTDPLSDAQFNWKPSEKAWSVGECVVHLNKVAEGYVPALEKAVAAGDAPRAAPPFRYGWASRFFIRAVRPEARGFSTVPAMKPPEPGAAGRSQIDKARALAGLDAWTARYVGVVEASDGLDLARVKMRSPFLWLLRLPVGAFIEALGQHALRHTQQAERVTLRDGFPNV